MTPTTINRETLRYALSILDKQQSYAADSSKLERRFNTGLQQGYYKGLRDMLDIILTDGFRRSASYVNLDASGHHSTPAALAAPESAADLAEAIPF